MNSFIGRFGSIVGLLWLLGVKLVAAETQTSATTNEFASVRFDNDSTCIVWPDGSVEKVTALAGKKESGSADIRIWYLTVAMNLMAKKGFVVVYIDNRDVLMSRTDSRPKREYAAVRFTGENTSLVWPDGKQEKVSDLSARKSHEPADIRLWYLTVAMNAMGRRGFQPTRSDRDAFWRMDAVDVWMDRVLPE